MRSLTKRHLVTFVFVFAIEILSSSAHADLFIRGEGISAYGTHRLIYDDCLNITWYDYSNKLKSWNNQHAWTSNLIVEFDGQLFDDWRLPSAFNYLDASGPSSEPPFNRSEMGHLFYDELGGTIFTPISASPDPDLAKFTGLTDRIACTGFWKIAFPVIRLSMMYPGLLSLIMATNLHPQILPMPMR